MERGSLRALLMVALVIGMLVGQSRASFSNCYAQCFFPCESSPNKSFFSCTVKCAKDCLSPFQSSDIQTPGTTHDFCKLGCAFSLCSALSTKEDPAGEKEELCLNSCSNKCTEYHPSPSKTQQISPAKP